MGTRPSLLSSTHPGRCPAAQSPVLSPSAPLPYLVLTFLPTPSTCCAQHDPCSSLTPHPLGGLLYCEGLTRCPLLQQASVLCWPPGEHPHRVSLDLQLPGACPSPLVPQMLRIGAQLCQGWGRLGGVGNRDTKDSLVQISGASTGHVGTEVRKREWCWSHASPFTAPHVKPS